MNNTRRLGVGVNDEVKGYSEVELRWTVGSEALQYLIKNYGVYCYKSRQRTPMSTIVKGSESLI